MDLSEALKNGKKKFKNDEIDIRKPIIHRNDRPYSECLAERIYDKFQITSNDNINNNKDKYSSLTGNEKKLINYICSLSVDADFLKIGPVYVKNIIANTDIKMKSIKKTISRLTKKGFIQKTFNIGRNGCRTFKILEEILLSYESRIKDYKSVDLSQDPSVIEGLPKEWQTLDVSGLNKFGFTKNHLIQIYQDLNSIKDTTVKETLTIESIQHSMHCFRWDLQNNYNELKGKYASPIKMFIGSLSRGRPYNSIKPETFKTPEQIEWDAYNQHMERKINMLEQIKKQSFSMEFDTWYGNLTEEGIYELLSDKTKEGIAVVSPNIKARIIKNNLLEYFEKYIWPDFYKKIIKTL